MTNIEIIKDLIEMLIPLEVWVASDKDKKYIEISDELRQGFYNALEVGRELLSKLDSAK